MRIEFFDKLQKIKDAMDQGEELVDIVENFRVSCKIIAAESVEQDLQIMKNDMSRYNRFIEDCILLLLKIRSFMGESYETDLAIASDYKLKKLNDRE